MGNNVPAVFNGRQAVLWNDLSKSIMNGEVALVIGSGVSIAACRAEQQEFASWKGLLENGLDRCLAYGKIDNSSYINYKNILSGGNTTDLLAVANKVEEGLDRNGNMGRFQGWINKTVGSLSTRDRRLVEALSGWHAPICTTNYDGLIEEITGQIHVTLDDYHIVESVLDKKSNRIIHLHGYWESCSSLILGIKSYEDLLRNKNAQNLQQALFNRYHLVFIGCGHGGISDPNLGALFDWVQETCSRSTREHYILIPESERRRVSVKHPFVLLYYGKTYDALVPVIQHLSSFVRKEEDSSIKEHETTERVVGKLIRIVSDDEAIADDLRNLIERGDSSTPRDFKNSADTVLRDNIVKLFIEIVKAAKERRIKKSDAIEIASYLIPLVMDQAFVDNVIEAVNRIPSSPIELKAKTFLAEEAVVSRLGNRPAELMRNDKGELVGKDRISLGLEPGTEDGFAEKDFRKSISAQFDGLGSSSDDEDIGNYLKAMKDIGHPIYTDIPEGWRDAIRINNIAKNYPNILIFILVRPENSKDSVVKLGENDDKYLEKLLLILFSLPDDDKGN